MNMKSEKESRGEGKKSNSLQTALALTAFINRAKQFFKIKKVQRTGLTLVGMLVFSSQGYCQSATVAHLGTLANFITVIVNCACGIFCLIKLGQIVYKAFFSHREFGADLGMACAGILVWALFVIFGNDILASMGSSAVIP